MYLFPETILNSSELPSAALRDPCFKVHETLLEQGSGPVNEDMLAADSRLSIVCDGATTLYSAQHQDAVMPRSGGQKAASITASVFANAPERNLLDSARRANELIREAMIDDGLDLLRREQLWSTSFAAVQLNEESITWCQTGDCMILVIHRDGGGQLVTELPGQDREVLKTWQQIGARSNTTIQQRLASEIASVRGKMNKEFGVLNGEDEAMNFVSSGTLEIDQISDVLLFSDGLFPPSTNPDNLFDSELFVRLYKSGGLKSVRNHIRSLQDDDPGCYHYPRFKMYDDISGVALKRRVIQSGSRL
ncbi:MAG: protein phosphatase 2C domain-containing protein [Desulfocapsaceae bacterium]